MVRKVKKVLTERSLEHRQDPPVTQVSRDCKGIKARLEIQEIKAIQVIHTLTMSITYIQWD